MNDDLIRRSDLRRELSLIGRLLVAEEGVWYVPESRVWGVIENLPVVEAAPVRYARWHTLQETKLTKTVECTKCNADFRFKKKTELNIDLLPYCPACGAKMREVTK